MSHQHSLGGGGSLNQQSKGQELHIDEVPQRQVQTFRGTEIKPVSSGRAQDLSSHPNRFDDRPSSHLNAPSSVASSVHGPDHRPRSMSLGNMHAGGQYHYNEPPLNNPDTRPMSVRYPEQSHDLRNNIIVRGDQVARSRQLEPSLPMSSFDKNQVV